MLLTRFIKNIKDQQLFHSTDLLLLAVSGGVDSVVLCELCRQAGFRFEIAHVNFQLRGEESEADEKFVTDLANKFQVPVHVRKFDTMHYAETMKLSIQVAARELRYTWFASLLGESGKFLLTAHHADDNIETVLMNFFRGTGISGLRGMLPCNERIIRPLLPFSRQEILLFAKKNVLHWREDSSNASDKYSRNYFRSTVIPMVSRIFPEVEQNLADNISRFADIEILYHQAISFHKRQLLEVKGNEVHIPILKLRKSTPLHTIVYEIIRPYQFTAHQTNEVIRLLDAEQGKYVRSATHRIFKNRNWMIISPFDNSAADNILIEEDTTEVDFRNGRLELKKAEKGKKEISSSAGIAILDSKKIVYPFLLRKWKHGDYFYPLGMDKKKKISRFLIDQKLSPTEKENTWVLESDKRICWIVGMRIDDRFKVTESTGSVVVIRQT